MTIEIMRVAGGFASERSASPSSCNSTCVPSGELDAVPFEVALHGGAGFGVLVIEEDVRYRMVRAARRLLDRGR